jgi:hypothetical protein
MKAYDAWLRAKDGQKICRISKPTGGVFEKGVDYWPITTLFGVDFSADDWEVVKKKHSLTLTNTGFSGGPDYQTLADVFRERSLKRPDKFTKITFEWEE